jgi:tetratricopeptide (TPR) repeat protein
MPASDDTPPQGDTTSIGHIQGQAVAVGANARAESHTHLPPRTTPPPPAFQVPYPQNPLFVGRLAELQQLAEVLLAGDSAPAALLPAVSGLGGIGKTQLASEFAHRYRDDFPGGVFWLNMERAEAVAGQVAACAGPGGLELEGWQAMDAQTSEAAVKRAWCEPVHRLLVFDNLEEPQLLADWRPVGGGTRVLITTRRGVWAARSGVKAVPLVTLARAESLRVLLEPRARLQDTTVEALLADVETAEAADAICNELGDLPLALALAAAYLESSPRTRLARYLEQVRAELLAHPSLDAELEEGLPTQHAASVTATIALSYAQLDPSKDSAALRLLHRMAHCAPVLIPRRLLVRLCSGDPDQDDDDAALDKPLHRLAGLGLVESLEQGVVLHRLVAAFVRERDTDAQASEQAVEAALINEISPINEQGYPLAGAPYLPHLQRVAEEALRQETQQGASLLNTLGRLLRAQGDYAGARPYFERSLRIREQVFGSQHLDTAQSLHSLGALLHAQGDYAGARPYVERALRIREQVLGSQHLDIAASLNNMGALLRVQGDYAGARHYYERALQIREQVLGSEHPLVANSLNALGYLLRMQGDYAGARHYYERALQIREQVLGSEHPDTAQSLNNMGALLRAQGDYAGARPYVERALRIREQMLGPQHPDTALSLNNVGALLQAQGDYVGAHLYLERALRIRELMLGPEHPDTATALNNLGGLLQAQGDLAGARPYYERALKIREQVLGAAHPDTTTVRNNLAALDAAIQGLQDKC